MSELDKTLHVVKIKITEFRIAGGARGEIQILPSQIGLSKRTDKNAENVSKWHIGVVEQYLERVSREL